MRAVIPAAGQGTRLYPHTHTKPKAMVRLAGRPILGHILSNIADTSIEEVCIVVGGSMKEQIIGYTSGEFDDRFSFEYVNQENAEGLGHSIYQAEEAVRGEPVLIALGDMLFENGYNAFLDAHESLGDVDGSIGVKHVDQPEHYGIVEMDGDRIVRLVEKPAEPPSNTAISGVYVIENTDVLFEALEYLVENGIRGAGDEYQLTDALQRVVDEGAALGTFPVENWYDCGRHGTLLEANRVLLDRIDSSGLAADDSVILDPVDLGADVVVSESVVGPNVSVDDGTRITDSIVRDSIIGRDASLSGVNIEGSIVGDRADVRGEANHLNVGDNSQINL